MPQLRKDPIIGRWIIISTERAKRPKDFAISHKDAGLMPCPFCEGHENMTPPEIFAFRKEGTGKDKPGWQVRVVPSKHLVLRIGRDLGRKAVGIYDVMNSIGAHEIIIENPKHITHFSDLEQDNINLVIKAYINRIIDLKKDMAIYSFVNGFDRFGEPNISPSISRVFSKLHIELQKFFNVKVIRFTIHPGDVIDGNFSIEFSILKGILNKGYKAVTYEEILDLL